MMAPMYSLEEYLQLKFAGENVYDPVWEEILAEMDTEAQPPQDIGGNEQIYRLAQKIAKMKSMTARTDPHMGEHGMNCGITPTNGRPA